MRPAYTQDYLFSLKTPHRRLHAATKRLTLLYLICVTSRARFVISIYIHWPTQIVITFAKNEPRRKFNFKRYFSVKSVPSIF